MSLAATQFNVVINDEQQYSIWPGNKPVPAGWQLTGFSGSKETCLAHIDENWTDMRPLSLREHMNAQGLSA
jgi:MbtH protein